MKIFAGRLEQYLGSDHETVGVFSSLVLAEDVVEYEFQPLTFQVVVYAGGVFAPHVVSNISVGIKLVVSCHKLKFGGNFVTYG